MFYNVDRELPVTSEEVLYKVDDFVSKCKEYLVNNDNLKTNFINDEIEDYRSTYYHLQLTSFGDIKSVLSDYGANGPVILNEVFSDMEHLYNIKMWQHLTYSNGSIIEGKIIDSEPISMTMILVQDYKDNVSIVKTLMKHNEYVLIRKVEYDIIEDVKIIGMVFVPAEENPINNFLYEHIDDGRYNCLYWVEPKDDINNADNKLSYHDNYFYETEWRVYIYDREKCAEYFRLFKERTKRLGKDYVCNLHTIKINSDLLNSMPYYKHSKYEGCCIPHIMCHNLYDYVETVEDIDLSKY